MSGEPESSSQALERYLKQQLEELEIQVPEDDLEMMARFVEEEGLEKDEKVEGVRAMLEGVVESMPEGVDDKLGTVVDEYDRLHLLDLEAEAGSSSSSSEDEEAQTRARNILETMTPEEKAAARKAALLRQYAYVDADPDDLSTTMSGLAIDGKSRDPNAPPPPVKALKGEEKAAEERRKAIEEALRLDGKKKKHRKNKEVDLLAPNLNKEKMLYVAKMEREAQKNTAQQRKDRDKAALDKQRADAAAAKAAKQKKAAKQERRG